MKAGKWSRNVPYGALEQVDVLAKQRTNKAVGQDSTVLWEIPPDAEKLSLRFHLATGLTEAAAKARSKPPILLCRQLMELTS